MFRSKKLILLSLLFCICCCACYNNSSIDDGYHSTIVKPGDVLVSYCVYNTFCDINATITTQEDPGVEVIKAFYPQSWDYNPLCIIIKPPFKAVLEWEVFGGSCDNNNIMVYIKANGSNKNLIAESFAKKSGKLELNID